MNYKLREIKKQMYRESLKTVAGRNKARQQQMSQEEIEQWAAKIISQLQRHTQKKSQHC